MTEFNPVHNNSCFQTPEKPVYPGGSWHVEGMANERIIASGIYYYDSENISESELQFRSVVTAADIPYNQDDNVGVQRVWGLERLVVPYY